MIKNNSAKKGKDDPSGNKHAPDQLWIYYNNMLYFSTDLSKRFHGLRIPQ